MPTNTPALVSVDPLARLAEQQTWITPQAEMSAQRAIWAAVDSIGGEKLRSVLHGDFLHEPLHAIMTDIPVGAWTAAVVFDAIGATAGSTAMDKAADASVIVGLVGAAGAAITGMNDWSEVKEKAPRKIGAVHALLNIVGTGLFAWSCFTRSSKGSRTTARSAAILGYLVVSASAHLGGNMVYEHGVGVAKKKPVRRSRTVTDALAEA